MIRHQKSKNNWWRFEGIGYNFFFPDITSSELNSAARPAARRRGWRFTMRKEGSGVRVWRVQ